MVPNRSADIHENERSILELRDPPISVSYKLIIPEAFHLRPPRPPNRRTVSHLPKTRLLMNDDGLQEKGHTARSADPNVIFNGPIARIMAIIL